ncbi:hypothetical protein HK100_000613 [Physocladia obscura]|uniref:PLOD1-3-like GT domain-containing protein n=1 Tax=Physocladia obscura TaxID=109957 RepID=A0AAD5SYD4_9FUNG|nr:hypothetical protein HK100_000613 [Physocladia obscura]
MKAKSNMVGAAKMLLTLVSVIAFSSILNPKFTKYIHSLHTKSTKVFNNFEKHAKICDQHFHKNSDADIQVILGPEPTKKTWNAETVLPHHNGSTSGTGIRIVGISYDAGNILNSMPFPHYMCETTIFSAALNDIPLQLYGAQPAMQIHSEGGSEKDGKIGRMMALVCALPADEVVMMIDAWDTVFQRKFAELEFLYAHKWLSPDFVIGAEANCWPDWAPYCVNSSYVQPNPGPTGFRFINSGTLIGKAGFWSEFLSDAINAYNNGLKDDQNVFAQITHRHYKQRGYFIDHGMELVGSLQPPAKFAAYWHNDRQYFVIGDTRTVPAVIHLNGGGKDFVKPARGDLWYLEVGEILTPHVKKVVQNYKIFVDGVEKVVSEICPDFF